LLSLSLVCEEVEGVDEKEKADWSGWVVKEVVGGAEVDSGKEKYG
jgi:hypothetical protein